MSEEKYSVIPYEGKQINLFSDDRNDYVCLTDMITAWNNKGKGKKNIGNWIRNIQTIDFLDVWEKKYNSEYRPAQLSIAVKMIKERNFSIKQWVELTNAKGIFTRFGEISGTYAHKDIAIKFAGWLSPEFELYLVEEIQKLKELEKKKDSYELLSHDQILFLVRLKEVFKYVVHQEIIEDAHKDVYAAQSASKTPFSDYNAWRNKILDIATDTINDRIKQYCIDNGIPLNKVAKKTKRSKILILDSYHAVRNAVWDFLKIQGEVNALNLANLVRDMMKTEKGEVLYKNEDTLFQQKQDLGEFNEFDTKIKEIPIVKTARETLQIRADIEKKKLQNLSGFDKTLKGILAVPPPSKTGSKEDNKIEKDAGEQGDE